MRLCDKCKVNFWFRVDVLIAKGVFGFQIVILCLFLFLSFVCFAITPVAAREMGWFCLFQKSETERGPERCTSGEFMYLVFTGMPAM